MYNKFIVIGHLTRDIEVKKTSNDTTIASTSIASTRKFKGSDGQLKEETPFLDVTFFGRTAENAGKFLAKGSKVSLDGRLKLDQWTADDGSKRSKHSLVVETLTMLGSSDVLSDAQSSNTSVDTVVVTYLYESVSLDRQPLVEKHIGNVVDITFPSYALQFVKIDDSTFKVTKAGFDVNGEEIIPEDTEFKI